MTVGDLIRVLSHYEDPDAPVAIPKLGDVIGIEDNGDDYSGGFCLLYAENGPKPEFPEAIAKYNAAAGGITMPKRGG